MTAEDAANVHRYLEQLASGRATDDLGVAMLRRVAEHLRQQVARMTAPAVDDGGPAFPAPEAGRQHFSDPAAYIGMSLRDYFAAKAVQGLLAQSMGTAFGSDPIYAAQHAYTTADAMLKERAK